MSHNNKTIRTLPLHLPLTLISRLPNKPTHMLKHCIYDTFPTCEKRCKGRILMRKITSYPPPHLFMNALHFYQRKKKKNNWLKLRKSNAYMINGMRSRCMITNVNQSYQVLIKRHITPYLNI